MKRGVEMMLQRIIRDWDSNGKDTASRLAGARQYLTQGKAVPAEAAVALLEAVLRPGDKVNIEGDNQKQADFLAKCLCQVDLAKIHDLHMIQSTLSIPEHLDVFEKGIAKKLDFSYSGGQGERLAGLMRDGKIEIGAIHTYLELYGRYFVDLTPRVALLVAEKADYEGNLYTGFSTEDTPAIIEATKFRKGIVIVQVNEIVAKLPRVDIPGDWVDFVIESPEPFKLDPLFTKDPALISDGKILKAMLALKGIYQEYEIKTLNHGVGFDTAAIELILPTYGEELGLKGKVCTNFILNPHPTIIPAIETGWVQSIHSPGGEIGMEEYVKARPDIFFIGPDGNMRSNRVFTQVGGHYAIDMFIGSTLQIDPYGNSSTATKTRVAGFGGAPNLGCDAKGRRHTTAPWLQCGAELGVREECIGTAQRGKKLVVQLVDTLSKKLQPGFVEELDAVTLAQHAGLSIEPIMIYGDDLTHIISEVGIAYLHKCRNMAERTAAIRGIAGKTEVGVKADPQVTQRLRELGIIKTPADLQIDTARANKSLLAAKSIRELVEWSGGLYNPPAKYRNW